MTLLARHPAILRALVTAALFAVAWTIRWWRSKQLSGHAKQLLGEIRADTRSDPKGLTVFVSEHGWGDYLPFRWTRDQEVHPVLRETDMGPTLRAVEELVRARLLEPEPQTSAGVSASYRLVQ